MSLFKRKEVVLDRDKFPVVFMSGGEIVEVGLLPHELVRESRRKPPEWRIGEIVSIPVPGEADRIVYELPDGCWERVVQVPAGYTAVFGPLEPDEEREQLQLCQRTRLAQEALSER